MRVFDVDITSLLAEHTRHLGKVNGLAFSQSGEFLYSAGSKGTVGIMTALPVWVWRPMGGGKLGREEAGRNRREGTVCPTICPWVSEDALCMILMLSLVFS